MQKHRITLLLCSLLLLAIAAFAKNLGAAQSGSGKYRVTKTIAVGGDEGWDYVTVDSAARRVYVSHGSHVVILDADSDSVVGDIPDTQGVHGIAIASDAGRGFTSNGRANTATMFDLKSSKVLGVVKTGTNPDAIIYDAATKRVFTMNGRSQDTTAINAADGTVVGTLALGGKPEFAVAAGDGTIFVNIEDKSELVHFDAQKLVVLHRWPMAPCEEPSGLAGDLKTHRLFAGCSNKLMAVINADNGKVVATVPIGDGVDANGFDPETNLAFASTGDGNITVAHEDSPDKYTVVATVPTKKSARTMGLDLKTHKIFLPAADFDPPAPGERRGKIKAGSFVVLVAARE
ncbi:MAG TPA: YncE family protein [Candidatus Dormibacteraeota bacterium]|jgi:DNA-binding beta-propeller fold protein YncE|nr:YncE family protein [Candidatus Dormibacteraeota bacterium]